MSEANSEYGRNNLWSIAERQEIEGMGLVSGRRVLRLS